MDDDNVDDVDDDDVNDSVQDDDDVDDDDNGDDVDEVKDVHDVDDVDDDDDDHNHNASVLMVKKQRWENKRAQMVEDVMSNNVEWETYFKKVKKLFVFLEGQTTVCILRRSKNCLYFKKVK